MAKSKKNYAIILENHIIGIFLDKEDSLAYYENAKKQVDNNLKVLHDNRLRLIEFITIEDNLAEIIDI